MSVYPGLLPLPTDPMPGARVILDKFRGVEVALEELLHGGLHLAAYALGQFHDHPPIGNNAAVTLSDDTFQAYLEDITQGKHMASADAIPWDLIFAAVLRLIELWLKK